MPLRGWGGLLKISIGMHVRIRPTGEAGRVTGAEDTSRGWWNITLNPPGKRTVLKHEMDIEPIETDDVP